MVYILLDVLVRSLDFDDGHFDDFEDDVLLFGEESKSKVFKTKIIGFAETMVPRFEDKEFKSYFRLNRSSVQVRLIMLHLIIITVFVIVKY